MKTTPEILLPGELEGQQAMTGAGAIGAMCSFDAQTDHKRSHRRRVAMHVDYTVVITVVVGLLLAVAILIAMNWLERRPDRDVSATDHSTAGMPPARSLP